MDDIVNGLVLEAVTSTTHQTFLELVNDTQQLSTGVEVQLKLYDILVPLLGFTVIVLNLAVVISSGLILQTSK